MAVFTALASAVTAISGWTIGLGALGSFAIGNFLLRSAVQLGVSALAKAFAGDKSPRQDPFAIQGQIRTGGAVPRSFVLGPGLTAGSLVWHSEWGKSGNTPNAYYTQVIALSDLPVAGLKRWFVNGQAVTLADTGDERGLAAVELRTGGTDNAWVRFHDGTQTAADTFLTGTVSAGAPRTYSATRIGTGIAYAVVTFRIKSELFSGFPASKFVLDGVKLYDPSKDDTAGGSGGHRWNDRATWGGDGDALPAVQAYNLARGLTFGGAWFYGLQGVTAARLPAAHWIGQIQKCRVEVEGDNGPEPIYRAGGEISVSAEIGDAFEALLTACAGRMSEVGGTFKLFVGAPDPAVVTITDEDIVSLAPQTFTPFFGLSNTVNGVLASYPSPDEGYVMRALPPLYNPAFEAEDGGRRLLTDIALTLVPFRAQATRLVEGELAAARRARRHTFTLPARFRLLEPGDVLQWNSLRNGYSGKLFRVDGVIDLPNCDLIVDVTEVDPSDHAAFDFEPGAFPALPAPLSPVRPAIAGVIGFGVSAVDLRDTSDKPRRPALLASWATYVDGIAGVAFEVRPVGGASFSAETSDFGKGQLVISSGILPGTAYQIRPRYVPIGDLECKWGDWLTISSDDVRLSAADLTDALNARIDTAFDRHDAALGDAQGVVRELFDAIERNFAPLSDPAPAVPVLSRLIPEIDALSSGIDEAAENVILSLNKLLSYDQKFADAGIVVDPGTGTVTIAAVHALQNDYADVETRMSAAEASITQRVTFTEMNQAISEMVLDPTQIPIVDELEIRVGAAETAISGLEASIDLKASNTVVEGFGLRIDAAEVAIDALEGEIALKVDSADFTAVEQRLSVAEVNITALDGASISQLVTDSSAQADALDELAMGTVGELMNAFRDREVARQSIAAAKSELHARVDGDVAAEAAARLVLAAQLSEASGLIAQEQRVRAEADSALASSISTQQASLGGALARISAVEAASVTEENAIAAVEAEISAEYGSLSAMASATAFAKAGIDGIASGYVWRLNGQNQLELVSVQYGTGGPVSTYRIASDYVQITGLAQINNAVIAEMAASNAFIENLQVDTLEGIAGTIGHFKSAASGERVEIEDDRISVFDGSNALRVRIGRL